MLASSAGCILSLDVLQLAEQAKKNKREAATGRPVALEAWEPAPLELPRRASGQPTAFRVRAYADEEFRLANVRWQERIRVLVEEASGSLEESLGARLTIESIRSWPRRGAKDGTDALLRALQEADAGADVDWVIGFVSPLGFATTSIHEIGMASVLGKHFVLRGIDDREEAAALAKHFTDVDEKQQKEFLDRRRHHKELVVFIHEWLHNLGAVHHADRAMLLHPSYAHQQRGLDSENAEVVSLALQARIAARGTGGPPDYGPLAAYLTETPTPHWYTADRQQLLAVLAQRPAPVKAAASSTPRPSPPVAPAVASAPAGAGLDSAGTPDVLRPLRAAVDERRWDGAIDGCLGAGPPPAAAPALYSGHLAELCARAAMIARADEHLRGAVGSPQEVPAREAIRKARLEFGVAPLAPALARADEAARARAWFAVRAALDANQFDRADAALRPALKRFGADAGLLALGCEASVRQSATWKDPHGSCERAVKAWDESPRALFWSALAQANNGDRGLAVTRLLRSKSLDPTFDGPWKVLADIYRFEGRRSELAGLRSEYRTRFGKDLR